LEDVNLILCYNTNGFYCHTLEDAARLMADLGYDGMALTPDVHHLDPFRCGRKDRHALRTLMERLGLQVVIETGARYVLDARRKHYPTLFTPGEGERRLDFLKRCVDMAEALGAEVVSFHSGGVPDPKADSDPLHTLARQVDRLLDYAGDRNILMALEPEPGMFIETVADYQALKTALDSNALVMTLDVGHAHISESLSTERLIRDVGEEIVNVHLDDARDGRHEHLPLGTGEIDFSTVLDALARLEKRLFLSVELSRHGHEAPYEAKRSIAYLKKILPRR
jgi:sugar phosphate isomerase/epimerase